MRETELRCENGQLLGVLKDGLLEVRCKNNRCKQGRAVVVYHYFDPQTGALKDTQLFRDPVERLNK